MYRLLFEARDFATLSTHLESARPSEDGAFLLLQVVQGAEDIRMMVRDVLLPPSGAWDAKGKHTLRPAAQWVSAAIGRALDAHCGLAFVHSHPDENHPPHLSPIDRSTSIDWARTFAPLIDSPFASLVWTPSGVAGWAFSPENPTAPIDVEPIEVLGDGRVVMVSRPSRPAPDADFDDRQVRALSATGNQRIRDLHVTVIGAGGTGSPLAEQLVRMGVARLSIIDADRIDTPSNLRRIVGARVTDLEAKRYKATVVAQHLGSLGLRTIVRALPTDVRTEVGRAALIDSDVVFMTTDTHSSRAFVNQLAMQCYVPVVDVGLAVGLRRDETVSGMPAEVRVLLPDGPCLWCQNVLDAGRIRAENLPVAERVSQEREGYIRGLGPQPSITALNFFAAGLAVITMLRLHSGDPVPSTSFVMDPWEQHVLALRPSISPDCLCAGWRGVGDSVPLPLLG